MKQVYPRVTPIILLFCAAPSFSAPSLHQAIGQGNLTKVKQIIEASTRKKSFFKKKIDLDEKDKNGHAPLIRAVALGYHDLARALILKGANLEITDFYGNTPLLRAVNNGDSEMVELLIRSGANLNAQDLGGSSVIQRAIFKKNQQIFEKLMELVDSNHKDRDQNSLLHLAAASGTAKAVHQLLARGLNPEAVNRVERTPFMVAVLNKNLETALALYQFGVSLYARDLWGYSAGEIAQASKFPELLDELIRHWNTASWLEHQIFFFLEYNPDTSNPGWEILKNQVPSLIRSTERLDTLWRLKQAKENLILSQGTLEELNSRIPELRRKELESLADSLELEQEVKEATKKTDVSKQEEKDISALTYCPICLEELKDSLHSGAGPADCDCRHHLECGKAIAKNALKNAGLEISRCGLGCRGKITLGFLARAGLSESEISEFSNRQLALRLASCPDWKFCSTADCINGKILAKKESSRFYCCLCEKRQCLKCTENHPGECEIYKLSVHEIQNLLRAGEGPKGRFRPCYHCGVITEKTGGCNHMTCMNPACRQDWDWNRGLYAGSPTFQAERMNYRPQQEPHL